MTQIAAQLGRTYAEVHYQTGQLGLRNAPTHDPRPSEALLAARDLRLAALAGRSLTGQLLGDPAPGESALCRRPK